MKPYASIETVWTRDKATKRLNFGHNRMPEVEQVKEWTISEKIDGMNIRVICTLEGIQVRGRTDNASIPADLLQHILGLFNHTRIVQFFTVYRNKRDENGALLPLPEQWSVTFYGEGYGAGIQKMGKEYSIVKRFRCFDLLLGESWWTADSQMRAICFSLGVPTAPLLTNNYIGSIPTTREELSRIFPSGYSIVAGDDNKTYTIHPEGVVAKPLVPLFDTHGNRVMWKLTFREF